MPLLRLPRPAASLALVALLFASATTARAQDARAPRFPVTGVVVDSLTGEPLTSATIELEELRRSTVTEADGRFAVQRVPRGGYLVTVRQLGYRVHRRFVQVADTVELGRVALIPEPVVLEALKVTYSRFETRRRAAAISVRFYDRRQLALAAAPNAFEFVRSRVGMAETSCLSAVSMTSDFDRGCFRIRGAPAQVAVWIDERPAIGGISELETYDTSELHSLEVYGGGRMIRAYTMWYMEAVARGRVMSPAPIIW